MITISVICLVLFFIFCGQSKYQFLSRNTTTLLKAVLPVFILLHHICLNFGIIEDFKLSGYYVVGLFFFISGFGLECKRENGKMDIRGLFERVKKLTIPIIVPSIVYISIKMIIEDCCLLDILRQSMGWRIILPYSWFVVSLLILTISFYVINEVSKSNKLQLIILICFIFAFSLICKYYGVQSTYYTSNMAFAIGALAYNKRNFIEKQMKTYMRYFVPLLVVACFYAVSKLFAMSTFFIVPIWAISVVSIASFITNPVFSNRIAPFSYEFYLCQGITFIIITCFVDYFGCTSNSKVFSTVIILAAICCNTLLAILCNSITNYVFNRRIQ